jgi:hypothetical protein
MAQVLKRGCDGRLAPTLGIAADGVFKQPVEGLQQVGQQRLELPLGCDLGGLCQHEIDTVCECFAQRGQGFAGRSVPQSDQCFDLLFDFAGCHGCFDCSKR